MIMILTKILTETIVTVRNVVMKRPSSVCWILLR